MKYKVKRDDEVIVISGAHKGKRGKILNVIKDRCRVVVEGVAVHKRHMKKSREYPEGTILNKEGSIHYSNVMLASKFEAKEKAKVR
ncbi:MAG: 50S ribosomal protein L24 [Puniceicoccales bacterium]|jgi:large subunit ribosomal protein L24|nr:50S ribosomal protein L24 [Puniceicoccales bacterium]